MELNNNKASLAYKTAAAVEYDYYSTVYALNDYNYIGHRLKLNIEQPEMRFHQAHVYVN